LVELGFFPSRAKAGQAIKDGGVYADGRALAKCSESIRDGAFIEITGACPYVGRGGLKLAHAIKAFDIDLKGGVCLDIGASTGGFTDCMLKNGAALVFAVDVGRGQLHPSLAGADNVVSLENTDIRKLQPEMLVYKGQPRWPGFITADLSFVSLGKVMGDVSRFVDDAAKLVVLIKPQFEAGRAALDKRGVVRKPADRMAAIRGVINAAAEIGFFCQGIEPSPILGGDGNEEYLALFGREDTGCAADVTEVVGT